MLASLLLFNCTADIKADNHQTTTITARRKQKEKTDAKKIKDRVATRYQQ